MAKKLRELSLVKLKPNLFDEPSFQEQPYINDMPLIFLGEIPNMPEHGVFIGNQSGHIYSGYHISDFVELSEEEV